VNDRFVSSDVRRARDRLAQLGRWYRRGRLKRQQDELDDLIAPIESSNEWLARRASIWWPTSAARRSFRWPHVVPRSSTFPRERFVRSTDVAESIHRHPAFCSTKRVSPHQRTARLSPLVFVWLELRQGDRVAELGTGSGYGAALASHIAALPAACSPWGEIDPKLAARATRLLRDSTNVKVTAGDAGEAGTRLARLRTRDRWRSPSTIFR